MDLALLPNLKAVQIEIAVTHHGISDTHKLQLKEAIPYGAELLLLRFVPRANPHRHTFRGKGGIMVLNKFRL